MPLNYVFWPKCVHFLYFIRELLSLSAGPVVLWGCSMPSKPIILNNCHQQSETENGNRIVYHKTVGTFEDCRHAYGKCSKISKFGP